MYCITVLSWESPHVSSLRTDAGFVEESSGAQAVVVLLVVRVVVKGMNLAAQVLFARTASQVTWWV